MDLYIVIVILITSIIQSLFGVGILLFGTPLLLLMGYPFFEVLLILLPISASINFLQTFRDYKNIDTKIYRNILFLTVPFIFIFLIIMSENKININVLIGLFLIFIALKEYVSIFKISFNKLLHYNKIFYIAMGTVHGITNLGGSLLTAKIFHTNLNKYQKRATIAISYMTFALFQIGTILFLNIEYKIENSIYIPIGIFIYLLVNKILFHKISDYRYDKMFSIFLLVSGISLVIKEFIW